MPPMSKTKVATLLKSVKEFINGEASATTENTLGYFGLINKGSDGGWYTNEQAVELLKKMESQKIVGPEDFGLSVASTSSSGKDLDEEIESEDVEIRSVVRAPPAGQLLDADDALKSIEEAGLSVTANEVIGGMESLLRLIPQQDSYLPGQIQVFVLTSATIEGRGKIPGSESKYSFANILGAGTKVLDAILFYQLGDLPGKQAMFLKHEVTNISREKMTFNLTQAYNMYLAAIVNYWVRGNLPQKDRSENPRQLMDFLKNRLGDGFAYENQVAELLSSAPIGKYPAEAFLRLDLTMLPKDFFGRIRLSPAGQKPMRYSVTALQFEQETEPKNMKSSNEFNAWNKIKHAQTLVKYCAEHCAFEYTRHLHPGNVNPARPQKFAMRMTNAVLHSLTEAGRLAMRESILNSENGAFKKDLGLMGVKSAQTLDVVVWPLMDNREADFTSLSVEAIRTFIEPK